MAHAVPDLLPPYVLLAGRVLVPYIPEDGVAWHIPDFQDKIKDARIFWIWSPPFSYLGCTWQFHLDADNSRKGGDARIKICRKPPFNGSKTVECTLRGSVKYNDMTRTKTFAKIGDDLELAVYVHLYNATRDFSQSNFRISCRMIEVVPRCAEVVPQSSKTIRDGFGTNPPGLVRDLERLLASGDVSDVTIRAGGEDIRAHRAILAARSDVFRAMFVHDTSESASGVVDIVDCEPDTFRKFLAYLYAGRLEKIPFEDAIGLYITADKYQVEELRQECLELIKGSLSLTTFCSAVTLMVKHGQREGITRLAAGFLRANVAEIIRTVDWETFLCQHPKEANELLREALGSDKK